MTKLVDYLHAEVIGSGKKFGFGRLLRRYYRNPAIRYIFWWRISSSLFETKSPLSKKIAKALNRHITIKYGTEIELGARIGAGITFAHHNGVVISRCAVIGRNFHIRQNTTIGIKDNNLYTISIGDNVEVGANSVILGGDLKIGNNVIIGAMSFINKDLPDNVTCYNSRSDLIINKNNVHG